MNFTQPAFVRVQNPTERKELIEWLKSIGYENYFGPEYPPFPSDILYETPSGRYAPARVGPDTEYYDCGTSIPLFMALAAMNDSNDREQWFTDGHDWAIYRSYPPPECLKHTGNTEGFEFFGIPSNHDLYRYRRATAAEIIEYFKSKSDEQ